VPEAVVPAAAAPAAATAPAPVQSERPPRHGRKGRPERHERPERREGGRPSFNAMRSERREKAPDPNSPFAKLAALKAQLEANKERR
jgi:ATP-dependent RNA helicase SUPV3L1/SUV3